MVWDKTVRSVPYVILENLEYMSQALVGADTAENGRHSNNVYPDDAVTWLASKLALFWRTVSARFS